MADGRAMSTSTGLEPTSPGQSSPEPLDEEEEPNLSNPSQWQGQPSPSTSQPQRAAAPLQKRRRVTRACDECRRKKIKCDGKQPCTHCTVYSYDCTYDQPSNRRRNPNPVYIEALETRLHRAEAVIGALVPGLDLSDPNLEATIQERRQAVNLKATATKSGNGSDSDQEAQLRSMIESTGQLDLDEDGQWDFHGGSSGIVFINRMRQQFGGLLGSDKSTPFLPKLPRPYPGSTAVFDSPKSSSDSPFEGGLPNVVDLPPRDLAKALVNDSMGRGCALLRFVHQPSFDAMFDRVYNIPAESYGTEENRFLPLLYVVLALGCMFHIDPSDDPKQPVHNTYRAGIDNGLKYFRAARQMMDITDCRDLTSLQAILFMILFLQSTANLSTCYSYIGIALRSSLRMGLHRNLSFNFNPIERETRRRVFWIVRKMDTYVSALLGFPNMLSSDDIDQELPIEVDDEYITKDGILPVPSGKISVYAASNAHTRLMAILAKVIKNVYPVKGVEKAVQPGSSAGYVISHSRIREIEKDLTDWLDKLPMALRPDGDGDPDMVRIQQLLRLAFAHVQMMLYRPFLHYVSQDSQKPVDERSYACAAACVNVSRNVVHITSEMKKRGLLVGAYWFTMYTTFFAIISLVYFVLENPKDETAPIMLADANAGKDALNGLAQRSQAADRCSAALKGLFEKLPERLMQETNAPAAQRKKRAAPSPTKGQFSAPITSRPQKEPTMGISRATTFPMQTSSTPTQTSYPARSSLDGNRFQTSTFSNPNLRQSYRDYASPSMSGVGTPDSSSTGSHSLHQQQFQQHHTFGISNAVPDLNAMMFPSADPFAYPNQPMVEYDNVKRENMDLMMGNQGSAPMYLQSNVGGQGIYDDIQGQILGPLPPYLAQGQPVYEMQGQMGAGTPGMSGMPEMNFHPGIPHTDISFDGIFSAEGEDWGNMLQDQRFRQQ